MKTRIVILLIFSLIVAISFLPAKVEAKARSSYGSYKYSAPRNYSNGGRLKWQKPYYSPKRGGWTEGHWKTGPDQYKWNNRKNLYGF